MKFYIFSFLLLGFALQAIDVAIIGGGQSGLGIGLALRKRGIHDFAIYDQAPKGMEGPWLTTARMPCLRSKKEATDGPSLGDPSFAFQTWYGSKYGDWDRMERVPTVIWAEYLRWFREILSIPVENEKRLISIIPEKGSFKLLFQDGSEVHAKKVILATGRDGCGGFNIPLFARHLPKSLVYHTGEPIDRALFKDKAVCVIGSSASAFDAASAAIDSGAHQVDLVYRRETIPTVSYLVRYKNWSGYYSMTDAEKIELMSLAHDQGRPPPPESVERLMSKKERLVLRKSTWVADADYRNGKIVLETNQGLLETDLLILATGYIADPLAVPEISLFANEILTWANMHEEIPDYLASFPYLGPHFECREITPGSAPFLKDIHLFNYGAFLSQGRISGDIDQIGIGLERLAAGIEEELKEKWN